MAYVESIPADSRSHLEDLLDWDHGDSDLIEISQHILDWEELAAHLNLSTADISSINAQYVPQMHRYGCFRALQQWLLLEFFSL